MAILDGVEVFSMLPANDNANLAGQVSIELCMTDMMTAVEYWLQNQVLRPGITIDVVDISEDRMKNCFKVKFNQVEQEP